MAKLEVKYKSEAEGKGRAILMDKQSQVDELSCEGAARALGNLNQLQHELFLHNDKIESIDFSDDGLESEVGVIEADRLIDDEVSRIIDQMSDVC